MDTIKETSWSSILAFSILYCIYVTFINLVVFKLNIFDPIYKLTFGLINGTLMVNIISLILFVFIIILRYGDLSFYDIGFKKNRFVPAIFILAVMWGLMQLVNILAGLCVAGKPMIHRSWYEYGALRIFSNFNAQLLGNCLFEELAFRGFLLVQLYKKFKNKKNNLMISLLVSQLIFALIHIPNRILGGMSILQIFPSLIIVFILGILFSVIYLKTDNIFLSIGIHTLWNTPLLVFDGIPSFIIILIEVMILLVIWDKVLFRLNSASIVNQEI